MNILLSSRAENEPLAKFSQSWRKPLLSQLRHSQDTMLNGLTGVEPYNLLSASQFHFYSLGLGTYSA